MSAHLSTEHLSAYLDGELSRSEEKGLESHLESCVGCRAELGSLRRVVGRLQRLESLTPPPILAGEVARRVALEGRPQGLVERLESRLGGSRFDSPVLLAFTLVCALSAIVYSFARGVDRHQQKSVPIVVAPPALSTEYTERTEPAPETVEIRGRELELRNGVWWERSLGEEATAAVLGPEDPRYQALVADLPELEALLDRPVVLQLEGETVRLEAR